MNRSVIAFLAFVLIASGGLLIAIVNRPQPEPEPVAVAQPKLDHFELLDQTGARIDSREFAGQVWTASFFFCSCPSTCYQQNMRINQLQGRFAPQGLKSVSITCDPANDTPAELARYALRFNADASQWKFLTPSDGDPQYVQHIGNDIFQVMVQEETHTDRVMVIDRSGKIRGAYSVLQPKQFADLEKMIETLLAEPQTEGPQGGESATSDASESTSPTSAGTPS